ncbi:MAG: DUF3567 domain-containing protein [Gammaproteobacteria bacterium]|jgi:hypothetical protein|nr:DUF3567 domain-containing protein [Gammaproteobacteria bacterium]MBU0788078.1 DUF3567 domain-containing protein [Gammaproteobacteria bacterium]MBU0815424.1 DUF3567 domain-containing protein [Gammaproteobacteria bacterium]MBU1785468.1 DUF3567 domain-containing protein [Gammaproteobacteria bacterium]
MNMLYDSESFSVLHLQAESWAANAADLAVAAEQGVQEVELPTMPRHGFEIVDKRSGKEVYLDGSWAELFQRHLLAWQRNEPTQEEVEATLDQYAELAQNPVVVH